MYLLLLFLLSGRLSCLRLSPSPSTSPLLPCPKYICGSLEAPICSAAIDDVIEVSPCTSHSFCGESHSCVPLSSKYGPKLAYPGEVCSESVPCVDSRCQNGRCFGKSLGEPCDSHTECNPGLYCGFVCRKQIEKDSVGCRDEWDCENGAGCNYGECVGFYSLDTDEAVEICENYENRLCSTGQCQSNRCISAVSAVDPAFPRKCNAHVDCQGQDSEGNIYYSLCECGYNEAGNRYCSVFPGDEVGDDYTSLLRLWTNSDQIRKCNTVRRWEVHCMVSNWKKCRIEEFLYKSFRYENFPKIVENSKCISQSLTRDYWDIREIFRKEAKQAEECEFAHEYGTFLLPDTEE